MVIYKYFRINEYLYDLLISNQLYFSSIEQFNDPYDSMFSPEDLNEDLMGYYLTEIIKMSDKDKKDKILEAFRRNPKEVSNEFLLPYRNWLKYKGICCFSKVKDNILMWSHYAHSHTGVCLGFNYDLLTRHYGQFEEVSYKNEIVTFSIRDAENLIAQTLLRKSEDWKYEEEIRFFIERKRHHDFPIEALVEVNFGDKCSRRNMMNIIYLCQRMGFVNCEFKKITINESQYTLNFDRVDIDALRRSVFEEDRPEPFKISMDMKRYLS